MTSIFKTALSASLSIAMTTAVAAQPATFLSENYGPPGLEQQQSSAVSMRLVIPFGGYKNDESVANKARLGLSFAPNLISGEMWSDVPTTGLGLTLDGRAYSDLGFQTLSLQETALIMGVEAEEGKGTSRNNGTLVLAGAVVLVGGIFLVVRDVGNDLSDCAERGEC